MTTVKQTELAVRSQTDVVTVRQTVRELAVELGLSIVEQTMIVTAASEVARNTVTYGGGGLATMEVVHDGGRRGLRLTFDDKGPGIADVERALRDGFTTGSGLGLGLGGARRLTNEFSIQSQPGSGTRIQMIRWKG